MSKSVTLEEATDHLAELVDLAINGEEIVIVKNQREKVKLALFPNFSGQQRNFGQYAGKIRIHPSFDEPLPDDFWLMGKP